MLRKAMVDVKLRDGTLIPAGKMVATSQYAIHHDPRHYDRPDEFDPSRWEEEEERPWAQYKLPDLPELEVVVSRHVIFHSPHSQRPVRSHRKRTIR